MDPFFQCLLVSCRKKSGLIWENFRRFGFAIFPQRYISVTDPQNKTENKGNIQMPDLFQIHRLHGSSISGNLMFINNLGLSFSFGVCYNTMKWCYAHF